MKIKALFLLGAILFASEQLPAQCAMCRTTIQNNVSNGEIALAEGLNFGIMYLFSAPYLAVAVMVGVFIYFYRKNGKKS